MGYVRDKIAADCLELPNGSEVEQRDDSATVDERTCGERNRTVADDNFLRLSLSPGQRSRDCATEHPLAWKKIHCERRGSIVALTVLEVPLELPPVSVPAGDEVIFPLPVVAPASS